MSLQDELFVLAMGSNNQMGYLERVSMPGESWLFRARVVDLVDDSLIWEQIWVTDEEIDRWWPEQGGGVMRSLKSHHLEPVDFQMGEFPVILDDQFYTATLRRTASASDPALFGRLEVVVQSTGQGIKTVCDLSGAWRWASVLGFIPSPFENRLAIILLVQPEGWSGPQQPLRFLVAGASLKAGFAQP